MEAVTAAVAFSAATDAYTGSVLLGAMASIAPILGTVGSVLSVIQYISCIPTFIEVSKRKSTGNLSPMPYCTTSLLSLLWVTYGFMVPGRMAVLVVNAIALAFMVVYMAVFLWYTASKKPTLVKYINVFLCYGAVMGVALVFATSASGFLGNCCMVVSIAMYASPLAVVPTIIKTKDSSCMPPLYSLTGFIAAIVWFGYGLGSGDFHVWIPNGVGSGLCLSQLIIWFIYRTPSTYSKKGSEYYDDVKPGASVYYSVTDSDVPDYNSIASDSTVCSADYMLLDP
ncbi:sugar transporter [Perkinsus chesapeaki]|uniref:Sugar transporter SWEET1 n=1 Tax=Perkinsus chesapeaki TaxID=330153 RepID=A0A7J6LFL3_PERCH|nr:sugar transporter [Perkinsus chesapeaki]